MSSHLHDVRFLFLCDEPSVDIFKSNILYRFGKNEAELQGRVYFELFRDLEFPAQ